MMQEEPSAPPMVDHTCMYCLEYSTGDILVNHRFGCGCQIELHQLCMDTLMEQGMLEYCWYCQRNMLNHREENVHPAIQDHTPEQPIATRRYTPLNVVYGVVMFWNVIMHFITMIMIMYDYQKGIEGTELMFIVIVLSIAIIPLGYSLWFLVHIHPHKQLQLRMIFGIIDQLQMYMLLIMKHNQLSVICGFANIMYQLFMVS